MIKNALGLIETVGLATGIEAADAAVKSAHVRLIGYELTKGDGMCTVKIEGDIGAVKAAIDSAKAAAGKIGVVYSSHVISRPAQGLNDMIFTKETVGIEKEAEEPPAPKAEVPTSPKVEEPVPALEEKPKPVSQKGKGKKK